jgi:hypothetical protein
MTLTRRTRGEYGWTLASRVFTTSGVSVRKELCCGLFSGFLPSLYICCKSRLLCTTGKILICDSYNSAVFSSIAVNNYFALSVSESFLRSDECHNCGNLTAIAQKNYEEPIRNMWAKGHNNELERLSNGDCLKAYAEMLQTKRRNVLLVASDDSMPPVNASTFGGTYVYAVNAVAATTAATSQEAANIYGKSQCSSRHRSASRHSLNSSSQIGYARALI